MPGRRPASAGRWAGKEPTHLGATHLGGLEAAPPVDFGVFDSGMMRPKNTLLAAFGVTRRLEIAEAAWNRNPCSWCSLADCRVRGGPAVTGA